MFKLNSQSSSTQEQQIQDAFSSEKLYYDNIEIFSTYIDNLPKFQMELNFGVQQSEYNYDTDEDESYVISGQEVYLGYSPKNDTFFVGFDMFGLGAESSFIEFKIVGSTVNFIRTEHYCNMFYFTGFEELKEHYKDLINIRLD